MKEISVKIKRYPIKLGQFLKHISVVSDGLEAKILITSGGVIVNGSNEQRRGRQLFSGDTVRIDDIQYICVNDDY